MRNLSSQIKGILGGEYNRTVFIFNKDPSVCFAPSEYRNANSDLVPLSLADLRCDPAVLRSRAS